jgi:hypothetical protein
MSSKLRKMQKSVGILEIIHTDIYDLFPITSVDGYDLIIYLRMIILIMDIFI